MSTKKNTKQLTKCIELYRDVLWRAPRQNAAIPVPVEFVTMQAVVPNTESPWFKQDTELLKDLCDLLEIPADKRHTIMQHAGFTNPAMGYDADEQEVHNTFVIPNVLTNRNPQTLEYEQKRLIDLSIEYFYTMPEDGRKNLAIVLCELAYENKHINLLADFFRGRFEPESNQHEACRFARAIGEMIRYDNTHTFRTMCMRLSNYYLVQVAIVSFVINSLNFTTRMQDVFNTPELISDAFKALTMILAPAQYNVIDKWRLTFPSTEPMALILINNVGKSFSEHKIRVVEAMAQLGYIMVKKTGQERQIILDGKPMAEAIGDLVEDPAAYAKLIDADVLTTLRYKS